MRKTKLFLLLSLFLVAITTQAYNVGDVFTTNGISYKILTNSTTQGTTVNPGTVAVSGCTKKGSVSIPVSVTDDMGTNYNVVRIASSAFKVAGITEITVPEGVTSADNSGFGECTDLVTVNLPSTITSMGVNMFAGSNKLQNIKVTAGNTKYSDVDGVLCSADQTELIVYPQGRTATSYTVPSTIKVIKPSSFMNVPTLASIDLGQATTIEGVAFNTCNALTSLTFPVEMTTIPVTKGFYTKCPALAEFNVKPGNTSYSSDNGILFNAAKTELIACPQAKTMTTGYSIPTTVTKIWSNAFYASRLTSIIIPSGVVIDEYAFDGSRISSLTINEGVTTIGNRAFTNCASLTTVTVPKSAVNLGENIFLGCLKLQTITVAADNANYESKDGVMFKKGRKELYSFPPNKSPNAEYTIPAETEIIGTYAFHVAQYTGKQVIPTTVKTINPGAFESSKYSQIEFAATSQVSNVGSSAFRTMPNLTSIEFPASIQKMGAAVCFKSPKLASVTFASNSKLTTMEGADLSGAFEGCTALTTVTVGDNSPIPFGNSAFKDCTALTTVTVGTGSLASIGNNTFLNCKKLTTLDIKNSALSTIGTRAFQNCEALTSVEMPKSLKVIGESAFTECKTLATVTFPDDALLEKIGRNAFQNSAITGIKLPTSLKTLGVEAFNRCKQLTSIDIPAGTTNVASQAFTSCSKLTSINVDSNNPNYASLDGMLVSKDKTRLMTFPPGKANSRYTRLPSFITAIDSAFYSCEELTNVTIPRTVTDIGNFAFSNTKNLTSISFLGNIPTLANEAFLNTDKSKITLYVRKGWFEDSANAATIQAMKTQGFKEIHPSFIAASPDLDRGVEYFPTSINTVGVIAFTPERTSVIVPASVKEVYNGKTTTYEVATVLDYAFQNNTKTETVVFLGDLEEIGLDAFSQTAGNATNAIKNIYFVDNTAPEMASVHFEAPTHYPFTADQKIYVKPSKVSSYQAVFKDNNAAVDVTANITSEIPTQTSMNRATACYPFDVTYKGDVMPYLPLQYKTWDGTYYVRSLSVDDGYIPANLGVLLRSKQAASVQSYCEMTEAQDHAAVNNSQYSASAYMMTGVVEDTQVIGDGSTLYALSKQYGEFRKIKTTGTTIPYFKAYIKLPAAFTQAKNVVFLFDDEADGTTTGIESVETHDGEESVYYNLNGMRVDNPTKGVYIRNGKKVIIK